MKPLNAATLGLIALVLVPVPAFAQGSSQPDGTLIPAFQAFNQARQEKNALLLRRYVEFFGRSAEVADRWVKDYVAVMKTWERGGIRVVAEMPVKVEYFSDKATGRQIAFIDAVVLYQHPFDERGYRSFQKREYGFSDDGGRTWKFNIADCISESELRKFSPAYAGTPAFGP